MKVQVFRVLVLSEVYQDSTGAVICCYLSCQLPYYLHDLTEQCLTTGPEIDK